MACLVVSRVFQETSVVYANSLLSVKAFPNTCREHCVAERGERRRETCHNMAPHWGDILFADRFDIYNISHAMPGRTPSLFEDFMWDEIGPFDEQVPAKAILFKVAMPL